ncbi:hypothetical protein BH20ACI1_BH20ACI1_18330 [soil metagenome]
MENKGLIYEKKIKDILTKRNFLPPSLAAKLIPTKNDAGFVHDGKEFFLELKNISAPDYGASQINYEPTIKNWKWNKIDEMTLLFDRIGLLQKVKQFVPRKFIKEDHELTEADKRFDRTSFAHRVSEDEFDLANLAMSGANFIHEYYAKKECYYIQIEGKGFYHLLKDPAKLGVPQFLPPIVFRLRAKTHGSQRISNYSFRVVITASRGTIVNSGFDIENPNKFPL